MGKVSTYCPHFLIVFASWFMNVGPGSLFFHKLHTFEVLDCKVSLASSVSVTAAQLITVPFVRNFFYSMSMPCFALLFYCVTFLRKIQDPDLALFIIALAPTILTCLRVIFKYRSVYATSSILFGAFSVVVAKLAISSGLFNFVDTDQTKLLYVGIFVQYMSLSVSVMTGGLNYYKYTHPKAALLSMESCHNSLRTLYSAFSNIVMTIWHHWDIVIVFSFLAAAKFIGGNVATYILLGGCTLSLVFSIFATKCILQLRMMDLLLPCFGTSDKEKYDARKLVKPIGAIAFGIAASPSVQALFLVGYLYCQTFQSNSSGFYSSVLLLVMFTGSVLNCFMRILSLLVAALPGLDAV